MSSSLDMKMSSLRAQLRSNLLEMGRVILEMERLRRFLPPSKSQMKSHGKSFFLAFEEKDLRDISLLSSHIHLPSLKPENLQDLSAEEWHFYKWCCCVSLRGDGVFDTHFRKTGQRPPYTPEGQSYPVGVAVEQDMRFGMQSVFLLPCGDSDDKWVITYLACNSGILHLL